MLDTQTAQRRADALQEESERDALGPDLFISLAEQLDNPAIGLDLQTQLFRLIGNACIDHDVNREKAVKAELPRRILRLVAASLSQPKGHDQLLFLRAAAGSLLNLVMDNTPAQEAFTKAGGLQIFLSAIDPSAPSAIYKINAASTQKDAKLEDLEIAAMTQLWFFRVFEELHESKSHAKAFEEAADHLVPLATFVLSSQSYFAQSITGVQVPEDLLKTESNSLLLAASLFEALSMDIDALAIAISQSSSTLLKLCDFVEADQVPASWRSTEALRKNWNMIKSATSKGLIAAVSMDDVMVHCLESEGPEARPWIVQRCQTWLQYKDRNDLKICSTVMLANLARNDENCLAFVQDLQLVPVLFQLLERCMTTASEKSLSKKSEATQILHGVLSLLKHLSIPAANKPVVGAAGPFNACISALDSSYDGAQPVQIASIGLIKHLVTSCSPNAATFLAQTGSLDSLLSLSSRTDDVRLKSESTRVLVQLIRTLWMSPDAAHTKIRQELLRKDVLSALAEMVKASSKWPILVHEGVVSLALLGSAPQLDFNPLIEDDAFLKTLAKGLADPLTKADTNGSGEASGPGKKRPTALPEETRLNILSLLQVVLLNGQEAARTAVDKYFRSGLAQIEEITSSNPALREKAQQILSSLSTKQ